jgi:hypothetical protein
MVVTTAKSKREVCAMTVEDTHDCLHRGPGSSYCGPVARHIKVDQLRRNAAGGGGLRTLPVNLSTMKRDTVTVAVLFMKPTLVTRPVKDMGGILGESTSDGYEA